MSIWIVDSNYLQDPLLEQFLSRSGGNAIAIPDLISVEMHKGDAALVARCSTAITHRFPQQVFVLRSTRSNYTRRLSSPERARQLIDRVESQAFARYGAALQRGDMNALVGCQEWKTDSEKLMGQLHRDSAHIPSTFKSLALSFRRDQLRAIRLREAPFEKALQWRLLELADEITFELLHGTGVDRRHWPATRNVGRNTVVYRYALSMVLLYTRWVFFGQQVRQGPDKIVNDMVDMHLATLSTFFAGVLTKDEKLTSIAAELRFLVQAMGGYVG